MMDYEWRIKLLEEEARHEKAMRELQGTRLNSHDRSIEAIHAILDRTEQNIEQLSVGLKELTAAQAELTAAQVETQKMLQLFIDSLTRSGNGKN
jgi:hypothetical protein